MYATETNNDNDNDHTPNSYIFPSVESQVTTVTISIHKLKSSNLTQTLFRTEYKIHRVRFHVALTEQQYISKEKQNKSGNKTNKNKTEIQT